MNKKPGESFLIPGYRKVTGGIFRKQKLLHGYTGVLFYKNSIILLDHYFFRFRFSGFGMYDIQ